MKDIIKKLFHLSIYTSLLIGVLSIIPMALTFWPLKNSFYLLMTLAAAVNFFIFWIVNIVLVYLFQHKKSSLNNYILRIFFSFLFSVLISGSFLVFLEHLGLKELFINNIDTRLGVKMSLHRPFLMALVTNTFVLIIMELVILNEKKAKIEIENAHLKAERTEAINMQLKQHIHPHFLFNSLSILKSLINENPDLAQEYVIKMSDFLRLSVSSNDSNVVSLADELKMCEDYIAMQQIRFGNAIDASFEIDTETAANGFVPGFSLQLLLENAIKHNAFTESSPLIIKVTEHEGWLRVSNNIQKKRVTEETTKYGLANLSKRYQILSKHDIVVQESDHHFIVFVKILGNENSNN